MSQGLLCRNGIAAKVAAVLLSVILALGLTPARALAADAGFEPASFGGLENGTYGLGDGGTGYDTGMIASDEKDFPTMVVVRDGEAWLVTRSYAPKNYDAIWKGKRSEAPADAQAADVIAPQWIEDVDGAYHANGAYSNNVYEVNGKVCKALQFAIPLTAEELEAGEVWFTLRRALWSTAGTPGGWMGTGDHKFVFGTDLVKISDSTDVPGHTSLEDGTYSVTLTPDTRYNPLRIDNGSPVTTAYPPLVIVDGVTSYLVFASNQTHFDEIILGHAEDISDSSTGYRGTPIWQPGRPAQATDTPIGYANGMRYVVPMATTDLVAMIDNDSDEDLFYNVRYGEYCTLHSQYANQAGNIYDGNDHYYTVSNLVKTSDSTDVPEVAPYEMPELFYQVEFRVFDKSYNVVANPQVTVTSEDGTALTPEDGAYSLSSKKSYKIEATAEGYDPYSAWYVATGSKFSGNNSYERITLYAQGEDPITQLDTINTELMFGAVNTYIESTSAGDYLVFAVRSSGYPNIFEGTIEEAVAQTAAQGKTAWTGSEPVAVHEYYIAYDGTRVDSKTETVKHLQFRIPVTLDASGITKVPFVSVAQTIVSQIDSNTPAGQTPDYSGAFFGRQVVIDTNEGTATFGNYSYEGAATVSSEVAAVPVVAQGTLYTMGSPLSNEAVFRPTITLTTDAFDAAYPGTAAEAAAASTGVSQIGSDRTFTVEYVNSLVDGKRVITIADDQPAALSLHVKSLDKWLECKLVGSFANKTVAIQYPEEVAELIAAVNELPATPPLTDEQAQTVREAQTEYEAMPSGQQYLVPEATVSKLESLIFESSQTKLLPIDLENMFKVVNAGILEQNGGYALVFSLNGTGVEWVYNGLRDAALDDLDAVKAAYAGTDDLDEMIEYESRGVIVKYREAYLGGDETKDVDETSKGLQPKYTFVVPITDSAAISAIEAGEGSFAVPFVSISDSRVNRGDWPGALIARQAEVDLDAGTATFGNYVDKRSATVSSTIETMPVAEVGAIAAYGTPADNTHGLTIDAVLNTAAYDKVFVGTPEAAAAATEGVAEIGADGAVAIEMWNYHKHAQQYNAEDGVAAVAFHVLDGAPYEQAGTWITRMVRIDTVLNTITFDGDELVKVEDPAVAAVEAQIAALTDPDDESVADIASIEAAAAAYDALNAAQQEVVAPELAAKLQTARATLDDLKAAKAVVDKVAALPAPEDVTLADYDAINEAAKAAGALEGEALDYFKDTDECNKLASCQGAFEEKASAEIERIEGLIDALSAPENVTTDDAAAITEAAQAYDALPGVVKELVNPEKAAKLAACEEALAAIKATPTIKRIAGENYANETAAAISQEAFESADAVVLARDDDFADALGATGLAGALDAPIVLTDRMELSDAAAAEITRLGATKCYIIGGTGAMKEQLDADLKAKTKVTTIERVWGENSYDTSLACAKAIENVTGKSADTAIIAMSTNFQDALSMSSYAYKYKVPVVLQTWGATSAERGFTDEAAAWLSGKSVLVAGGAGAISNESVAPYTLVDRLWGDSGYDTSQAIAEWMVGKGYLSPENVVVTCGAQAPKGVDALAGAALGGKLSAPMLLATTNEAMEGADTTTIDRFYTANAAAIKHTYVLGGAYVMPQALYDRLKSLTGAEEA